MSTTLARAPSSDSLRAARVAATISSPVKARLAAADGADCLINYREADFAEEALRWSGGLQVGFDNAGAEVMQKTYRAMAPYGRIVSLMGIAPDDADLNAYNLNLTLHNVMMLTPMWKHLADRLKQQAAIIAEALKLVAGGRLKIRVAESFALAEAAKAQSCLESGQAAGKVVLRIS